jgi:sodium transport system permease protein
MKWQSVRLIYLRELRDQLRDRRTLFTIGVLPILLYPLLGMCFLQITQFRRDHDSRILLVGPEALPADPALLASDNDAQTAFAAALCPQEEAQSLTLATVSAKEFLSSTELSQSPTSDKLHDTAQRAIQAGDCDAVIYIPAGFAAELERFQRRYSAGGDEEPGLEKPAPIPQPIIFTDRASDKSRIASSRLETVLSRWRKAIVRRNLEDRHVPAEATEPFEVASSDVAEEISLRAAAWSKLLPFVVVIWALTGAFYPAIDLCAGEKERGTLETLLSSPAERSEIVFGKLLTVVTFSVATAILNLASMGMTGAFVIAQLESIAPAGQMQLGPPPLFALFWLVLALPLISGLFGALSLAVAAFARSSKEGQYYLMPLLLITLPLMLLSMLPGAELDLGTSLVPVTGMLLLLRTLIEAQYLEAARYAVPVIGVTAACCLLAVRWAIDQFRNESVLFRESERFRLGLWLRHVVRDRGETPRVSDAILCGVLLLILRFFVGMVSSAPQSWNDFSAQTVVLLVALIATPALLMAIMLTRNPRKTLLLKAPHPIAAPAAVALALLLHPSAVCLAQTVQLLYPMSEEVASQIARIDTFIGEAPSIWALFAVMALAPALCEEFAFRGFILSGLRHMGHKWAAIVLSSVFFGATHGILQQSLAACIVGVVLGFLAVQTGSLLPSICFHLTYNAASIWMGVALPKKFEQSPVLSWLFEPSGEGYIYRWPVVIGGAALAVALLYWFRRLPHQSSAEESLQEALDHQKSPALGKPSGI